MRKWRERYIEQSRREEEVSGGSREERAVVDWWNRFRDDCLGLWSGSRIELIEFLQTMNSVDGDIKFTSEINWDENKLVFLDLTITIDENGYLQTDLYTKPNAKNGLLLPSSAHKPSVTRSSVYSLALRIIRICSQEEDKDKRLEELAAKLRMRDDAVIEAGIARAKAVERADALKRVEK